MEARLSAFRKLIKLAVRIIFSGDVEEAAHAELELYSNAPGQPRKRKKKEEEANLAIVIIDALTYHEWVSEDKFAEKIHMSGKQTRQVLQFLERQGFVVREHRRERKRRDVVEAVAEAEDAGHVSSYVSIDYPHFFDMLRLRLHLACRAADDKVDDGQAIKTYRCCSRDGIKPFCGADFTSYSILQLEIEDGMYKCNMCDSGIVAPVVAGLDDKSGERRISLVRRQRDIARGERKELKRVIAPLEEAIARLKDVPPPDWGSFTDWVQTRQQRMKANAARDGANGAGPSGGARGGRLDYGIDGPIMGDPDIVVSVAEGPPAAAHTVAVETAPRDARESLPYFMRAGQGAPAADGVQADNGDAAVDGGAAADDDAARQAEVYEAYVKAYMEQVAALTAAAGGTKAEPEDDAAAGAQGKEGAAAAAGRPPPSDEPEAKRIKVEVKSEPGQSEEAIVTPGQTPGFPENTSESAAAADGDDDGFEWEDAGAVPTPQGADGGGMDGDGDDDDLQWEDS